MTGRKDLVELQAEKVRYFSPCDESAFFEWLGKVPSIVRIEGRGSNLSISVDASNIDETGLRDLLALFRRYEISLAQFIAFDREEFAGWFRSREAYWRKDVFG